MSNTFVQGHAVLDRRFHPEPSGRAPAGAFGRRSFGRASPSPASEFEVERILSRCRARRAERTPAHGEATPQSDTKVYAAAAASLLAFCVLSVLPVF